MAGFVAPLAIAGISALGGLFGNKSKTLTQTQKTDATSNISGSQSGSSSVTPNYDPETLALRNSLISGYGNSLNEDPNLSGYQAEGLNKINQAGDLRTQAIQNSLASRGLSYSPLASFAPTQSESARIGDSASFVNSIPLLARQLRDQRLAAAGSFLHGLPIGQTTNTTGTSTGVQTNHSEGTGTNTDPGNPLGGGLAALGTTLAGLYGYGAFDKPTPAYGTSKTGVK